MGAKKIESLREKLKFGLKPMPQGAKFTDTSVWLSTWFGSGLLRPAPGTMGSLAALPFGFVISFYYGEVFLGLAALALLVVGTFAATAYGKKSGEVDDQSIVVDEVVGVWIAAIPAGHNFYLWGLAFLLFRLFDIWKPWPACFFDNRSKGGFDVMMDDVIAGIYALFGVAMVAVALI